MWEGGEGTAVYGGGLVVPGAAVRRRGDGRGVAFARSRCGAAGVRRPRGRGVVSCGRNRLGFVLLGHIAILG
jgi:hypothetical protein